MRISVIVYYIILDQIRLDCFMLFHVILYLVRTENHQKRPETEPEPEPVKCSNSITCELEQPISSLRPSPCHPITALCGQAMLRRYEECYATLRVCCQATVPIGEGIRSIYPPTHRQTHTHIHTCVEALKCRNNQVFLLKHSYTAAVGFNVCVGSSFSFLLERLSYTIMQKQMPDSIRCV